MYFNNRPCFDFIFENEFYIWKKKKTINFCVVVVFYN